MFDTIPMHATVVIGEGEMDEDGSCGKPFMLPQKHPAEFYSQRFLSFNVPEFVTGPVELNKNRAERLINSPDRVPFGYR